MSASPTAPPGSRPPPNLSSIDWCYESFDDENWWPGNLSLIDSCYESFEDENWGLLGRVRVMPVRPMFPLGSVLLPGMVLPLHVFEDRYRALVRDCMAGDRQFGVTLIERGSEVGGGDIRAMAGTVAHIVQADELPDGRWAMVAVGTHRVRVREWMPDDPYPRAEVEDWPDVPATDPEAAVAAYEARVAQLRRILTLAVELGAEADPLVELADDAEVGSYQIGVLSPIGALDRQRLLTAPGPQQRLDLLEELLDDQELMLRARLDDL